MAAIYNFTQVPLTLPLQAAVKNRHGRRVIRGEEKEEKRIFFFRKKGGILKILFILSGANVMVTV